MIHCMKYTHDSNIQERLVSFYYRLHTFDLDFEIHMLHQHSNS